MQTEVLQDRLRISRQRLELVVRILRQRILHQLHFLKLMLANDAARVASVAAGIRPKTRRVSAPEQRQLRGVEYLLAMIIRDRHFRRRDQVKLARIFELEKIGFKLRQLPGAEKCG